MPLTFETKKAFYETSSETHFEILEKLSKLAQKYNLGKCSAEELFAFCKKNLELMRKLNLNMVLI